MLEARRTQKRYGGVRALRGANLKLGRRGAVHCLIGENGSGKSTLLGVLSGQVQPDTGEVQPRRQPVTFSSPPAAVRAGIAMVSQETAVAPHLSVAENILLGERLVRRRGRIDWGATRRRAQGVSTVSTSTTTSSYRSTSCAPTSGRWSRSPAPSRSTPAS